MGIKDSLEKEIQVKDRSIQMMINNGLTEFCESGKNKPNYEQVKENFSKLVSEAFALMGIVSLFSILG